MAQTPFGSGQIVYSRMWEWGGPLPPSFQLQEPRIRKLKDPAQSGLWGSLSLSWGSGAPPVSRRRQSAIRNYFAGGTVERGKSCSLAAWPWQ